MLFSEARKFVYIAVPKTATTSVERELQRIDPDILRNQLILPSGKICPVSKHINLVKVQSLLGEKASEYKYFGFIRDPLDHVISRYFYYTTGRGYRRYKEGKIGSWTLRYKVSFSRLIPRPLWFMLYPLRQQTGFFRDQYGRMALDFCGRVDRLDSDFEVMLRQAGYDCLAHHQLPRFNVAPRDEIGPLEKRFIKAVVKTRLRDDIAFYKHVVEEHRDVS